MLQAAVLLSQVTFFQSHNLQHPGALCLLSERRKLYCSLSDHVTCIKHHPKLVKSIETRSDLRRTQSKNTVSVFS